MARAAAKRTKRPRQAPRPQPSAPSGGGGRGRDKALEDQLFFGRLRSHAKWAFLFLAIVFAGSFVFLGVGTGNSGLGDVFSGDLFGGSSGANVEKLQENVAKSPNNAAAQLELARGLESEQRFDEAIQAYQRYTTLRPNSLQGLNQLAALYEQKAQTDAQAIQAAAGQVQAASPGEAFGPDPTSQLGKALGSTQNPVTESLSKDAQAAYQQAIAAYQTTRQAALDVYKRIAKLSPNEAAPQLQLGYAAEQAGDLTTALATYRSFVRRFPEDPSTADVRRQITQLKKDLASAGTAGNPQTG